MNTAWPAQLAESLSKNMLGWTVRGMEEGGEKVSMLNAVSI